MWFLCLMVGFLSWAIGGDAFWAVVFATAGCIVGPIIFIFHWRSGYFTQRHPLLLYMLLMTPIWLGLAAFCWGLTNPGIQARVVGELELLAINYSGRWLPTIADWRTAWPITAFTTMAIASILPIMLLVESRWVIHRILFLLGMNAAILALLGYVLVLSGFDSVFGLMNETGESGFSMFFDSQQWAGFALIWTGVLLGLACYDKFTVPWWRFMHWNGTCEIGGAILLGSTIFATGTTWAMGAVSILFVVALAYLSYDHYGVEKSKLVRWAGLAVLVPLTIGTGYLGTHFTIQAIQSLKTEPALRVDAVQARTGNTALDLRVVDGPSGKESRMRGALEMLESRPLFGWGPGSYGRVYAFLQEVDLEKPYYALAPTNLAQALAERGILGTASWLVMGAGILLMLTRSKTKTRWLTHFLLMAMAFVAVLGVVETPFSSPATFYSFWTVICLAIRWTTIAPTPSTAAGARTRIVFSEAEMKPMAESSAGVSPQSETAEPTPTAVQESGKAS